MNKYRFCNFCFIFFSKVVLQTIIYKTIVILNQIDKDSIISEYEKQGKPQRTQRLTTTNTEFEIDNRSI